MRIIGECNRIFLFIFFLSSLGPGPFVNRMAGFSLYVSNTTFKEQGYLCYKDQSGGTPSVKQNISCSIYGRYVIYYNERSRDQNSSFHSRYAFNELCEVEVYGEYVHKLIFQFFFNSVQTLYNYFDHLIVIGCQGSYGDGCLHICPTNCLNGMCDTYTGRCLSCLSGYYGPFCENGLFFDSFLSIFHFNMAVTIIWLAKQFNLYLITLLAI